MKRFEDFVRDEYEFIYENCENMEILLDRINNITNISDDMKEKLEMNMFKKIIPAAIERMINNDFFWQTFHEEMDDFLIDAIRAYMISLNFE